MREEVGTRGRQAENGHARYPDNAMIGVRKILDLGGRKQPAECQQMSKSMTDGDECEFIWAGIQGPPGQEVLKTRQHGLDTLWQMQ